MPEITPPGWFHTAMGIIALCSGGFAPTKVSDPFSLWNDRLDTVFGPTCAYRGRAPRRPISAASRRSSGILKRILRISAPRILRFEAACAR